MSIIITTAYRSKLASTMIKPVRKEPGSILDLYNEGYTFQVCIHTKLFLQTYFCNFVNLQKFWLFQVNTEDWSVLQENLQESTDQRYVNIIDRCNNELTFCEALAATLQGEVAIIDEDTPMQYIVVFDTQTIFLRFNRFCYRYQSLVIIIHDNRCRGSDQQLIIYSRVYTHGLSDMEHHSSKDFRSPCRDWQIPGLQSIGKFVKLVLMMMIVWVRGETSSETTPFEFDESISTKSHFAKTIRQRQLRSGRNLFNTNCGWCSYRGRTQFSIVRPSNVLAASQPDKGACVSLFFFFFFMGSFALDLPFVLRFAAISSRFVF